MTAYKAHMIIGCDQEILTADEVRPLQPIKANVDRYNSPQETYMETILFG